MLYFVARALKRMRLSAKKNCALGPHVKICGGSQLVDCEIERYTYIGNDCLIVNAKIGSFCSVAPNCCIGAASHPLSFVSTSPIFHKGRNVFGLNFAKHDFDPFKKVIIGNDVWIGQGSFIKSGVSIDTGAVIGMGSVVTHDVGPYEIWAGNPARLIRKRFSDFEILKLLQSQWWKWPVRKIREKSKYFDNVSQFIDSL